MSRVFTWTSGKKTPLNYLIRTSEVCSMVNLNWRVRQQPWKRACIPLLSSILGENIFGDFDFDMGYRRHASTHHRSSTNMLNHNKTSKWLNKKNCEEASKLKFARKEGKLVHPEAATSPTREACDAPYQGETDCTVSKESHIIWGGGGGGGTAHFSATVLSFRLWTATTNCTTTSLLLLQF